MLLLFVGTGNTPFVVNHFLSHGERRFRYMELVGPASVKLSEPVITSRQGKGSRSHVLNDDGLGFLVIDLSPLLYDILFFIYFITKVGVKVIVRIFHPYACQCYIIADGFYFLAFKMQLGRHVSVVMDYMQGRFSPVSEIAVTAYGGVGLKALHAILEHLVQSATATEILLEKVVFLVHTERQLCVFCGQINQFGIRYGHSQSTVVHGKVSFGPVGMVVIVSVVGRQYFEHRLIDTFQIRFQQKGLIPFAHDRRFGQHLVVAADTEHHRRTWRHLVIHSHKGLKGLCLALQGDNHFAVGMCAYSLIGLAVDGERTVFATPVSPYTAIFRSHQVQV